jgi:hypothetical protein
MERMTGIEPALSAWEAEVLPLNYIRATAATRLDSNSSGSRVERHYGGRGIRTG